MSTHPLEIVRGWPKRPLVVVGSGESLTAKHIRHVAMRRADNACYVAAINDAIYPLWGVADWLHGCDFKWWQWHIQRVQHLPHSVLRTTLDETVPPGWDATRLRPLGERGYTDMLGEIYHGSNGGYQMVHAAIQCRLNVVMLGIDCRGTQHFFGDHPDRISPDWAPIAMMFHDLVLPALAHGVSVRNASPGSAVDAFPRVDLEEALS